MKQMIQTDKAPAAAGPYSQAVIAGDILYGSGQIPVNPKTGEVIRKDIQAAAVLVMENIGAVLAKAGMGYENIVKTTIFLKDMRNFDTVNKIYAQYFKGDYPARSCVQVAELPKESEIEIEFTAQKK